MNFANSVILNEKGRERKITKQRAFVKTLTALAIKGDIRAINALVACARNFGPDQPTGKSEEVDPEDLDILENFVRRQRHVQTKDQPHKNPTKRKS